MTSKNNQDTIKIRNYFSNAEKFYCSLKLLIKDISPGEIMQTLYQLTVVI
jgi:hypothetical protein